MNQNCYGGFHHVWGDRWWEPDIIEKRKQYKEKYIEEHDKITNHFTELRKSIADNGILRPVNIVSGPLRNVMLKSIGDTNPKWFPPHMVDNPHEALYIHTHGGSRVLVAEELGIDKIPCVVHDFSDLFTDQPLVTRENFKTWYGNDFMFVSQTPHIRISSHLHISNKKYRSMNHATRLAQQTAKENASRYIRTLYNLPKPPPKTKR
jgi:hypothetical protein